MILIKVKDGNHLKWVFLPSNWKTIDVVIICPKKSTKNTARNYYLYTSHFFYYLKVIRSNSFSCKYFFHYLPEDDYSLVGYHFCPCIQVCDPSSRCSLEIRGTSLPYIDNWCLKNRIQVWNVRFRIGSFDCNNSISTHTYNI